MMDGLKKVGKFILDLFIPPLKELGDIFNIAKEKNIFKMILYIILFLTVSVPLIFSISSAYLEYYLELIGKFFGW